MFLGVTIENVFWTYVVVLGGAVVVSLARGLYLAWTSRRRPKARKARCR